MQAALFLWQIKLVEDTGLQNYEIVPLTNLP